MILLVQTNYRFTENRSVCFDRASSNPDSKRAEVSFLKSSDVRKVKDKVSG